MRKSGFDNTLISFIKKNKTAAVLILFLLVGVLLLMLPRGEEVRTASDEESRVSELCSSISGVGKCSVMLNVKDGEVVSAAVICEGAPSARVEADVKKLIASLYDIGYHRVTVLKLSE